LIFPKIQDVCGEDSSKALRKVICFTKKISPFLIAFATHYLSPPFPPQNPQSTNLSTTINPTPTRPSTLEKSKKNQKKKEKK
jgi:hypothetical protein